MKQGKKAKKAVKVAKAEKVVKNIVEYYLMLQCETNVKEMASKIECMPEEHIELWNELDLMEIVMKNDSLIFQNGRECFIDPLDLEFIEEQQVKTIYQVSFEQQDSAAVRQVLTEILSACPGMLCSDTETFEPIYTIANLKELK